MLIGQRLLSVSMDDGVHVGLSQTIILSYSLIAPQTPTVRVCFLLCRLLVKFVPLFPFFSFLV